MPRKPPRDPKHDRGWLRVSRGRVVHLFKDDGRTICKRITVDPEALGKMQSDTARYLKDIPEPFALSMCRRCAHYYVHDCERGEYRTKTA